MTSFMSLTHLKLQNWCMKPFSGALYIVWQLKKRAVPLIVIQILISLVYIDAETTCAKAAFSFGTSSFSRQGPML